MQKLIVIAGPTAVGKSAVALNLAKKLGGEIVSADSVQVYRGLDIGSAKPSKEEQAQVPHHLLDIVDPEENYTVADFQRDASNAISDIHRRGKLPLLVGGTGLYIRAVVRGFAFTEYGVNKNLRSKLQKVAATEGPEALHARLAKVDPKTAENFTPMMSGASFVPWKCIYKVKRPFLNKRKIHPAGRFMTPLFFA